MSNVSSVLIRKFWQGWLVSCSVGQVMRSFSSWTAGMALATAALPPESSGAVFGVIFIASAVGGALLGLAQWLVLKWILPGVKGWAVATGVGASIGFVTNTLIGQSVMAAFDAGSLQNGWLQMFASDVALTLGIVPMVLAAINGSMIGLAQWVVLRNHVSEAGWWVLASGLGTAVASQIMRMIQQLLGHAGLHVGDFFPLGWVFTAANGAVYGAIAGSALLWLLRSRRRLS